MKNAIEVHAERQRWGMEIALYIVDYPTPAHGEQHHRLFASSLNWETVDDSFVTNPTMRISETAAQALIDQLWACGLRPTEAAGSAGSLAATQAHLQDMRKLVFEQRSSNSDAPVRYDYHPQGGA